jgi:hypothetical protein
MRLRWRELPCGTLRLEQEFWDFRFSGKHWRVIPIVTTEQAEREGTL